LYAFSKEDYRHVFLFSDSWWIVDLLLFYFPRQKYIEQLSPAIPEFDIPSSWRSSTTITSLAAVTTTTTAGGATTTTTTTTITTLAAQITDTAVGRQTTTTTTIILA
ncbi:unnamed protein product, partial [Amoebophrya sp. A120]